MNNKMGKIMKKMIKAHAVAAVLAASAALSAASAALSALSLMPKACFEKPPNKLSKELVARFFNMFGICSSDACEMRDAFSLIHGRCSPMGQNKKPLRRIQMS